MAVSIGSIFGEIELEDHFSGPALKVLRTMDELGKGAGNLGVFMTGFSAGLGTFAKNAVQAAGGFEQTKIAFNTMLGSAEKATVFLKEMQDFAAKTPFELPDLLEGSKRLLAFGFNAQQIKPMIESIGDAAAGLGMSGAEGIGRLAKAFGDMQAKGKVSAEEMRQFAEAGIPAWQFLADKIGTDIPTAMKKASDGSIAASVAIEGIMEGMNKKFGGMMEAQSRTLLGQISTLKDEFGFVMRDFGTTLLPAVTMMTETMQRLLPVVRNVAQGFAELSPPVKTFASVMIGIGIAIGPLLLAFASVVKAIIAIAAAIKTAQAAMFAFGNTVPILTARLWLMQTATMANVASLGTLAAVGAAAFIGWGIGRTIAELFDLDKKISETVNGVETLRNLEKGTGVPLAIKAGLDATQFSNMDEWTKKIQESKKQWDGVRESLTGVNAEGKVTKAITDDQIKAMIQQGKEADMLKKATALLGRDVKDLATAKRVLAMDTKEVTKALKDEKDRLKEVAEGMEANFEAISKMREAQDEMFARLGPTVEDANVSMLKLEQSFDQWGGAAALSDKQLQVFIDGMKEAIEAGGNYVDGIDKMRQAQEELNNRAGFTDSWRDELEAQEPWFGTQGTTIGKKLGTGMFDGVKDTLATLPNVIINAITGGGDVGQAIGATLGQKIGENLGKKAGEALGGFLGKAAGSVIPVVGTLVGSLIGSKIGGFFGKLFGGGEEKKVNDMRDQFLDSFGGFQKLQEKLAGLTNQDLVGKIFNAKTVDQFNAAVKETLDLLGLQSQAQEETRAALEKYNIGLEKTGAAFAQGELNQQAMQFFKEFELLTKGAGVSVQDTIAAMGEKGFTDFVQTARAAGATIPEALRPMVEALIESGQLLDENGEAFESAEDAGITFAQTMEESMKKLVEQIERMVNALLGIPSAVDVRPDFNVHGPAGGPKGPMTDELPAFQHGGIVTRPTVALVGEAGPEIIEPLSQSRRGSDGDRMFATVPIKLGDRQIIEALVELKRDNRHGARTRL